MKKAIRLFVTVLITAFLIALTISTVITCALGWDAVPIVEIRNDLLLALFIACVQLLWVGSDKNNKTYIIRTVIHFAVLMTGCTLLMVWFGWLPWGNWLALYYVTFTALYAVIWLIIWNLNRKKWKVLNRKLEEYKKNIQE